MGSYPLLTDKEKIMANLEMLRLEGQGPHADRFNGVLEPAFIGFDIEEKSVTMEFEVKRWHLNRGGILHGGMTSAFLDHMAGSVITAYDGTQCPTIDMDVRFYKSGHEGDILTCVGKIVAAGRKIFHIEVKLFNKATGDLIAMCNSSYYNIKNQNP